MDTTLAILAVGLVLGFIAGTVVAAIYFLGTEEVHGETDN